MNSKNIWKVSLGLWLCLSLLAAFPLSNHRLSVSYSEDEYPEDLDILEEFIQSYYLLLESDNYLKDYSYIDSQNNVIIDEDKALDEFYHKLIELRSGLRDRVTIYQLGDSHVQSGYFSGTARSALQKHFGNAGRGLVFPLKLARTNQPDDYKVLSSTASNSFVRLDKPRSMSGLSLKLDKGLKLTVKTNSFYNADCSFDSALLFTNGDGSSIENENAKAREVRIHRVDFDRRLQSADITVPISVKELYGISLQRNETGLLYHSMGVNGAGFYNLKDQISLFEQIAILGSDLIIISLGTNDAQGRFRQDVFQRNLQSFMLAFREFNPDVPVLFSLAPDSNKQGRTNNDVAVVNQILKDFANQNGIAFWDLEKVMGGKGSIAKWRSQSMAAKDNLHFTPKGYMLQGHLLYIALIKAYKDYSENGGSR